VVVVAAVAVVVVVLECDLLPDWSLGFLPGDYLTMPDCLNSISLLSKAGLKSTVMHVEYSEAHHLKFFHLAERVQKFSKNLVKSLWILLSARRAIDGNVGPFF
jgi:hypothetical protein